jgi:endonuclease/exonuclease/phosphatase family metal-dependent hydrolase
MKRQLLFLLLVALFSPSLFAAGEETLRIMNYNIQGLPLPGYDPSRYRDIGKALAKRRAEGTAPQVVALEESFADRTVELREEAGYPYIGWGPPARGNLTNSGVVVLSEYPILKSEWVEYKDCVSFDCFANKGVMHVRVKNPLTGQVLDIYNTHLNADPDEPTRDRNDAEYARFQQVKQCIDFVYNTWDQSNPALFVGDFNFHPNDNSYLWLKTNLQFGNAVRTCAVTQTCAGNPDPDRYWRTSLDHQFYHPGRRNGLELVPILFERKFKEKVDGRKLSDHDALEIHYSLRSSTIP